MMDDDVSVSASTCFKTLNNSSDARVARAFASGSVVLGLILSWNKPIASKTVYTASLLDAKHYRDSVDCGELAGKLLVVQFQKHSAGFPYLRVVLVDMQV